MRFSTPSLDESPVVDHSMRSDERRSHVEMERERGKRKAGMRCRATRMIARHAQGGGGDVERNPDVRRGLKYDCGKGSTLARNVGRSSSEEDLRPWSLPQDPDNNAYGPGLEGSIPEEV